MTTTLGVLEDALEDVRARHPDTPQWEFFEGLLTALLCTRRPIDADEWLPVAFGCEVDEVFANPDEYTRFMMGWMEREAQLRAELEASPGDDDDDGLNPAVVDWRGLLASLPEADRAQIADGQDGPPPALGQAWALGFLFAADYWSDDWTPPRDKEIAAAIADALDCIERLLEDDTAKPALNLYDPDGPPTVSQQRLEELGQALNAVHDLYDIACSLGPRMAPVRNGIKMGRNDPCPCGSGKKYKKCCGAS
ncbi:MAG: UPF0149 family protein [Desulfovibrionaceae bacterium]|nr:UPF0149 family protein [Desulfovibrionaceae bacterium]